MHRCLTFNIFHLRCSKIPSIRLFTSKLSSLLNPRRPLSLPSHRRPNVAYAESLMKDPGSELFNYTTGRFLVNDAHRLRERRRFFNIPGLFNIIARAVNCESKQIVEFRKLGEGGLNRVFLVTLDINFQLVARIPYPLLVPKSYAVASEAATLDFLRLKGLPVPKIYSCSSTSDNEAKTEYILMEYVKGIDLSQIWSELQEDDIILLMDQLANIESTMMSISFPAGGSIYYAKDLQELMGSEGIPLDHQTENITSEEKRFCIGPDVSIALWYGRREQLDVFRGPYEDAKSVLLAGAKKELACLDQFGAPRAPTNDTGGNITSTSSSHRPITPGTWAIISVSRLRSCQMIPHSVLSASATPTSPTAISGFR
ncbi:hypothetical protein HGRIS_014665 [Hohenbuehelia grisea]|uniref:Aminoglycoside phosphotransferase domain-containing protein n=1 Tax=Hohenbuehelia grisea TaxID=104357 RepID=A0ABR3JU43_9AGAR